MHSHLLLTVPPNMGLSLVTSPVLVSSVEPDLGFYWFSPAFTTTNQVCPLTGYKTSTLLLFSRMAGYTICGRKGLLQLRQSNKLPHSSNWDLNGKVNFNRSSQLPLN